MNLNTSKNAVFGTILHFIRFIIIGFIGFVLQKVLASKLSAVEYGIYGIILSSLNFSNLFMFTGLGHILNRYVPELIGLKQFKNLKKLIFSIYGMFGIFMIILTIIILSVKNYLINKLHIELIGQDFNLIIILMVLYIFMFAHRNTLHGFLAHIFRNLSEIIFYILKLGIITFLLFRGFKIQGVIYGLIIAYASWNLMCIINLGSKIRSLKEQSVPKTMEYGKMIRYGLYNYFVNLGAMFFDISIDIYMITWLTKDVSLAGIYTFGAIMAQMITNLHPVSIGNKALFPFLVVKFFVGKESLGELISFIFKLMFILGFPLIFITGLLSREIIVSFFDSKFADSSLIMAAGIFFFGISNMFRLPVVNLARVIDKSEILLYDRILVIYNFIMNIILIKYMGALGAMVSTGTTFLLMFIVDIIFVNRYFKFRIPIKGLLICLINIVPAIMIIEIYRHNIEVNIFSLTAVAAISFVTYAMMSRLISIFNDKEKNIINNLVKFKLV